MHTPGPWFAFPPFSASRVDHGYRLVAQVRAGGMCIYARANNLLTTDEQGTYYKWGRIEDDAALLAAAPDLLAALEDMTAWLETYARMKPAALDGEIGVSLIAARAALAKARP